MSLVGDDFINNGKIFHYLGAAKEKNGMVKKMLIRKSGGKNEQRRLEIEFGAVPCRALKTYFWSNIIYILAYLLYYE